MKSTVETSELIGPIEAARLLGVSRGTVRRWVAKGVLKPKQKLPSGFLRFSRAEVNRLAERTKVR
jgi:excisionase family DNA binding protein